MMLAVRAVGGVPLVCDDRSGLELRAQASRVGTDARTGGAAGWATLTSGSTGTPRIVLRTAESWSLSFATVAALLELTTKDALYLPSPLASSLSSFSIAHAYAAGIDLVLPRAGIATTADLAVGTVLHGTPRALRSVVEAIEDGAPRGIRAALVGGAHLDDSVRARAEALGIRVIAYYGAA
jgi:long-chain acyl-CoA synthetase